MSPPRRRPAPLAAAVALCGAASLACGGLSGPGGGGDDVGDDARAGCDALEAVLAERFTRAPRRSAPGDQTCRLESQGQLQGAGLPDGALEAALAGWSNADNMAADGLDGAQFGRTRGQATCKVGLFWDLVDMDTFETDNERVEVACGPLDAVR